MEREMLVGALRPLTVIFEPGRPDEGERSREITPEEPEAYEGRPKVRVMETVRRMRIIAAMRRENIFQAKNSAKRRGLQIAFAN